MDIYILQFILGVLLFFIINWIGKHSYSIGYMEISIFVKTEEAPALNFLIRVLTPIVFIIICSSILYYFKLDKYVQNIYFVNLFYILFRLLFNLITARGLLLNWYRQALYWTAILLISYITYDKIIKVKSNVLPDFTTIANELWIIIMVFIFQVANNVRLSPESTEKRKAKYLEKRYIHFKRKYNDIIVSILNDKFLETIAYSIIIYEDFNRPKIARFFERANQFITNKPHTLGVMQVQSKEIISDSQSVKLGCEKILKSYKKYVKKLKKKNEEYQSWLALIVIVANYNGGSRYQEEVRMLQSDIEKKFYKK